MYTLYRALSFSLAIFFIFTFVIFLFIYLLSCFRRRPPSPDHPTQPSDHLHNIPIIIYGSSNPQSPSQSTTTSPTSPPSNDNCSICLGEFGHGEEVRVLPKCSHLFHGVCIDQWLPVRSLHCPVCRERAIQDESGEEKNVNFARNCRNNRIGNGSTVSPSASLALSFAVSGHLRSASNL